MARETILAAAEGLLTEQGPQALKLADVAKAAGMAHANVLHHFGSIGEVQAALMERMIRQLVERVLAGAAAAETREGRFSGGASALFDAFEDRGAARLAAWLELTGEAKRLTMVREAIGAVVAARLGPDGDVTGVDPGRAEEFILLSVLLAMGVGLFGRSLSELMGREPGRAREMAEELLRARMAALAEGRA